MTEFAGDEESLTLERSALPYLDGKISEQIASFDASRKYYRASQLIVTLATAALSALTTILVGAGRIVGFDWWYMLPLVCSAAVTVAAAYQGFLRPKELWIQKTDTWTALHKLSDRIEFESKLKGGKLSRDDITAFYDTFESILVAEHKLWMAIRTGSLQQDERPRGSASGPPPPAG